MIRYVITHINKDGRRTLAQAMQGQYTYSTKKEAQHMINAMMKNNSMDTLTSVYRLLLESRMVDCYEGHHDPKTRWFD